METLLESGGLKAKVFGSPWRLDPDKHDFPRGYCSNVATNSDCLACCI